MSCSFCSTPCGESHCPFTEDQLTEERFEANMQIIIKLEAYLKRFRSPRFGQALLALNINPESDFYEESTKTLSRIKDK